MGKVKRRNVYELPKGGVLMRERKEKPLSSEWYEQRKEEKRLQQKLIKLKKRK